MAFPVKMAQLLLAWATDRSKASCPEPGSALFFTYDDDIDPATWDEPATGPVIQAWLDSWLMPLLTSSTDHFLQWYFYIRTDTVIFGGPNPPYEPAFARAPTLPAVKCVGLQMFAFGHGRRNRGCKFISNVPAAWVSEGHLNDAGVTAWNANKDGVLETLVLNGVEFTLVLNSWADSIPKPVRRVDFNRQLCNIKRRGRKRRTIFPINYFDFPPV